MIYAVRLIWVTPFIARFAYSHNRQGERTPPARSQSYCSRAIVVDKEVGRSFVSALNSFVR